MSLDAPFVIPSETASESQTGADVTPVMQPKVQPSNVSPLATVYHERGWLVWFLTISAAFVGIFLLMRKGIK